MQPIIHIQRQEHQAAIVFADDALLVAYKPDGMLTVPGRGPDKQDCLAARVQAKYADALTVHRLDMATSGLLVFARGALMQRRLSILFLQRRVDKHYTAVVAGRPDEAQGEINLPLAADWPNRPRQKVDHEHGKPSRTNYRVLAYDAVSHSSRLELAPATGRTHQLRVHLQAIGHAILGDTLYADREIQAKAERLLLHAHALAFPHPQHSADMSFLCPAQF